MPDETPPTPPDPSLTPVPPQIGSTGLEPNVAAGIACVVPLIGGIIFLLLEKRSAFVRFYSMQSIFFSAAWLLCTLALKIIAFVFSAIPVIGWLVAIIILLLSFTLFILWVVIYVVQIVKAFSGVEWEIPYLGPLARKQLAASPI